MSTPLQEKTVAEYTARAQKGLKLNDDQARFVSIMFDIVWLHAHQEGFEKACDAMCGVLPKKLEAVK